MKTTKDWIEFYSRERRRVNKLMRYYMNEMMKATDPELGQRYNCRMKECADTLVEIQKKLDERETQLRLEKQNKPNIFKRLLAKPEKNEKNS